jgi:HEAT repeat protein
LSRALVEGDPALRAAAGTALGIVRREARDALPALASARFDGDPAVERAAVEALGRLESGPVGHAAAGPAPADAKALATALADPVSAAATIESLAAGDPTSVALLRDALDDVDPVVRVRAAEALGGLGPLARGAEFSLLPLAKDPDPGVRAAALRSLVRIAATVPEAQTAFAAALNDADARVRYQALAGVTSVPRPSPAALRACAAALVDGDPGRTALAVEAAVRWKTPPDHAFWLAVVKLLETAPPSARVAAIRATSSSLDATHPLLVPVIDLAAVADATPVRAAAREAVVGRARKSPAVLAALVAHWYDAEASTANAYRELFAAVGDAAVPALAPYVGKGNEAKALQAVDLLDRSGAALLKSASLVLESSNGALAAVTWRVTAAFLDRRQAGVDAVVAALRHKSPAVRAGAAQLIARARGAFSPLLDALDEALRDAEAIEKDPAVAAAMRKAMEFRMR